MGNTPSAPHGSPARGQLAQSTADRAHTTTQSPPSTSAPSTSSRHPNLRLPMPQRPVHVSPQSSRPTSPSGARSSSPRRRKSLELPDLNKLSFTPAAPIPTTATQTENFFAPTTLAVGHFKAHSVSASPAPPTAPAETISPGKWKQALGGPSPLLGSTALGPVSKLEGENVPAPKTAPGAVRYTSVSPTRMQEGAINPYFPANPPVVTRTKPREASPRGVEPVSIPSKTEAPVLGLDINESKSASVVAASLSTGTSPLPSNESEDEPNDGLVNVPVQWTGSGKVVYVTGNFADNWKGRIQLKRSTHDFNTVLRLPPGQYRLKFIVDD
ncbi:MAG: hypothetical protein TREMPRED_004930, partial [Tremellales sp. Tagirdzhanova-0007]